MIRMINVCTYAPHVRQKPEVALLEEKGEKGKYDVVMMPETDKELPMHNAM